MKMIQTGLCIAISLSTSVYAQQAKYTKFSSANIVTDHFACTPKNTTAFFTPSSPRSPETQYMSMLSSWLAHEQDTAKRREQLENWGFTNHIDVQRDSFGYRAFVAEHNDFVLVSFRGSQTVKDYTTNAMFFQQDVSKEFYVKGAKIHKGMWEAYSKLKPEMLDAMNKINPTKKPLFIVGHSLGGVMATLFSLTFDSLNYELIGINTQAQPKVGNREIRRLVADKFSFILNSVALDTDITPMVPPAKPSAQAFSSIITDKSPKGRLLIQGLVQYLDYDHHAGRQLLLTETTEARAASLTPDNAVKRREINYWGNVATQLGDRSNLKELFNYIKLRFVTHHPDHYICALREVLDNEITRLFGGLFLS